MCVLPHIVAVHVAEVLEELAVVVDGVIPARCAHQHLVLSPEPGRGHQPRRAGHGPHHAAHRAGRDGELVHSHRIACKQGRHRLL